MNRKTIFLKTAFLLACLVAGTLIASAYSFEVDGIYYNLSSGKATVTYRDNNYSSYSGDVVIPESVTYNGNTYPVTAIGTNAFMNCNALTSVTIPNSITAIGSYAFASCIGLYNVFIPNSVTSIGSRAFLSCKKLESINIPSSVTSLGSYAFKDCINLTTADIGDSVTSIGDYTFYECTSLTNVTIGNSVKNIGEYAFYGCIALTSVSIPNSVTYIDGMVFQGCHSLANVSIGNSVKTIMGNVFDDCPCLTRVDITDLEAWCKITFNHDRSNPLYMAHHLYINGTEMTNLVIPNSITEIKRHTFTGCTNLTSVTIPNTVTAMHYGAFTDCTGLTHVIISDLESWCGITFEFSGNPLYYARHLYLNGTEVTNLVIPNSITEIKDYAFEYCIGLTNVTIPNTVTKIGNSAFNKCNGMKSVAIGNSVTSIGDHAFYSCTNLTNVAIPNSVFSIGNVAFSGCNGLTSVIFGKSITSIGSDAFKGCNGLTSIEVPNSVISIGSYAFKDCSYLTSVILGNSVSAINKETFYGCSMLTNINIPESVSGIASKAFFRCKNLKSIVIPNTVSTIGENAFYGCSNLTSVGIVGDGEWVNANNGYLFQYVKTLSIGRGITAIRGLQCAPTEVWSNALIPPVCDENTFTNYSGTLHVPAEAMVAYFMADYWQNFSNLNTDAGGKVTLNQKEATIDLGETLQLSAVVNPTGTTLVWQSSNPNIATVSENGLVTAVGLGECDIIAAQSPNIVVADTCHITVRPGEITLTLSEDSLMMQRGEETTLILTIEPSGTLLTPVWASSDENVATVTDGVVRAVGNGECDITATVLDRTATCHVTVGGQVVITLDQTSATVAVGTILTLYPTATPDVELELTATSSDPTVAVARVVNRVNGASAAPAPVSSKMVQVIGIKDGRVSITVGSADGLAIPARVVVTVGNGGFTPGDVNGDGLVNISDVTTLIDKLLNDPVIDNPAADMNGDGIINITDVTIIIDRLLNS